MTDIDVLVSDKTTLDLDLFEYWLDGHSGKSQAASRIGLMLNLVAEKK